MKEDGLVWWLEVEDDANDEVLVDDVVERWGLMDAEEAGPLLWIIRPGSSDFFLDFAMMKQWWI